MKIDKGIPIPPAQRPPHKWGEVYKEMEEGDSVLFPSRKEAASFIMSFRKAVSKEGYTARTRKSEGGVRVWKVKKEDS